MSISRSQNKKLLLKYCTEMNLLPKGYVEADSDKVEQVNGMIIEYKKNKCQRLKRDIILSQIPFLIKEASKFNFGWYTGNWKNVKDFTWQGDAINTGIEAMLKALDRYLSLIHI